MTAMISRVSTVKGDLLVNAAVNPDGAWYLIYRAFTSVAADNSTIIFKILAIKNN